MKLQAQHHRTGLGHLPAGLPHDMLEEAQPRGHHGGLGDHIPVRHSVERPPVIGQAAALAAIAGSPAPGSGRAWKELVRLRLQPAWKWQIARRAAQTCRAGGGA